MDLNFEFPPFYTEPPDNIFNPFLFHEALFAWT